MKKGYLAAVALIIVAVIAVAAVAINQDEPEVADTNTQPSTQQTSEESTDPTISNEDETVDLGEVIVFNGEEFSPANLTVKKGTTVTFRNESDTEVWPASDDHPTHTRLSGFDSQRSLEKGQSYSYTFTKVGEWAYHDHIFPGYSGVITVTE